jgi:hypothetical protein
MTANDKKYYGIRGSYFLCDFSETMRYEVLTALRDAQPREWRPLWDGLARVRYSDPNFAIEIQNLPLTLKESECLCLWCGRTFMHAAAALSHRTYCAKNKLTHP